MGSEGARKGLRRKGEGIENGKVGEGGKGTLWIGSENMEWRGKIIVETGRKEMGCGGRSREEDAVDGSECNG